MNYHELLCWRDSASFWDAAIFPVISAECWLWPSESDDIDHLWQKGCRMVQGDFWIFLAQV